MLGGVQQDRDGDVEKTMSNPLDITEDAAVRYTIVLPAYNEQERIGLTLDKIAGFVRAEGWSAEIVVVNDGSTDGTAELVQKYAHTMKGLVLLNHRQNHGKGHAVRSGMLIAKGEWILLSDSDLSSPITEAPKLFAALRSGADIAIGSRWLSSNMQTVRQPLHRQIAGRVYNVCTRGILGLNFADTQCGFKAFRRTAARRIFSLQRINRWGFDPEILYIARLCGLRVGEVPVEWANDDRSKVRTFSDGPRMFRELLEIKLYRVMGLYRDDLVLNDAEALSGSSSPE